jgi:hypothetical protein
MGPVMCDDEAGSWDILKPCVPNAGCSTENLVVHDSQLFGHLVVAHFFFLGDEVMI